MNFIYMNVALPYGEQKDGKFTLEDHDIVRGLVDIDPRGIAQVMPHAVDGITVIKYKYNHLVHVWHTFEDIYNIINSYATIDERFKEEVDSFANDNYRLFKKFNNSNREADEDIF